MVSNLKYNADVLVNDKGIRTRLETPRTVSVIIPSKRSKELKRCLLSLEKQTCLSQMREVIVVSPEKCIKDNTLQLNVRNIVNKNANQAEARNIAEKFATGSILAFCDDDCVLPPNWIETAIRHFCDNQVGTVGGPSVPPFVGVSLSELLSGSLMVSFLGTGSHKKAYIADSNTKVNECTPVNIVCANMFVDRAKFNEVGGFDPIVPQEEDRLNTKIINKGYTLLYDPECSNIHYQRQWGIRFIRNIFWLMAGQGSLSMDRLTPSSKLYLIPPLFVIGLATGPIFLLLPLLNYLYIGLIVTYLVSLLAETSRLVLKLNINNLKRLEFFLTFPFALFTHHIISGFGFLYGFVGRFFHKLRLKF
jgi:glycosyltransferase involved in cell wall biosynthesis